MSTILLKETLVRIRRNQQTLLSRAPIFLFISAALAWAYSLPHFDLSQMTDLGLISILPAGFYVAIVLLTCGFCIEISSRNVRIPVILPHIIILILMLYGTPALIEEAPRYAATWKHLGVTDYIIRHGSVDPTIDAYFNWPGFFALSAFISDVAGVSSLVNQVAWVYVFFNVLFLAPLLMIFRAVTSDPRLVWLAAWLFYLANWVGQDYFAPQAFAFFLYLVILAVLIRWFKQTPADHGYLSSALQRIPGRAGHAVTRLLAHDDENAPGEPWQRVGLIAAVLLIAIAMIPTHQLTPFAALFVMGLLFIFDRIQPRTLPILMLTLILVWMTFMAIPYMRGRIEHHMTQVGRVETNSTRSVAGRFSGSQERLVVLRVRVIMTLAVGALALGGIIRRFRQGHRDLTLLLLALAPTLLVVVQAYGGEMALRIYFFVLPVTAFFAAACLYSRQHDRMRIPIGMVIGLTSLLLFAGFIVARYGNERMDYYTAEEVAATQYLLENAEPGSIFYSVGGTLTWRAQGYEQFRRNSIGMSLVRERDFEGIARTLNHPNPDRQTYLIISRSSSAYAEIFRGIEPGSIEQFEQELIEMEEFTVFFDNEDATIFILSEAGIEMGRSQ